jgi:hypothetical protein
MPIWSAAGTAALVFSLSAALRDKKYQSGDSRRTPN